MIDEIQLLDSITETADMGRDSLKHVIEKATDSKLKAALAKQFAQYDQTYQAAEQMLAVKDKKPQKVGKPVKIYSHMVSDMKTMAADDTTSQTIVFGAD